LLGAAERHGVLANIYPFLAPYAPNEFHAAYRIAWAGSQLLVSELESLLDEFSGSNIQVLPLKGPVLAETLYGDVTLRRAGDLDLLVDKRDYSAAEALLLRQGYRETSIPSPGYHWTFERGNMKVELHFGLGDPIVCPLQTDKVRSRSVPATFRGRPMRAMQREDFILFLCYHLLKHGCGARLLWLLDFSRAALSITAVEWDLLLAAARKQRMESSLLFCCALARKAIGIALPDAIAVTLDKQPEFARKASWFLEQRFFAITVPGTLLPNFLIFCEIDPWQRWQFRLRNYFTPKLRYQDRLRAHRFLGPLLLPAFLVLRIARALRREGVWRYWRMFIANER
jgi:hypothetical protein